MLTGNLSFYSHSTIVFVYFFIYFESKSASVIKIKLKEVPCIEKLMKISLHINLMGKTKSESKKAAS